MHWLSADWPTLPVLMAAPVLLQERMVYLSHIYQLAASARSVVAENKMLRMRLEASKKGSATLVLPAPCCILLRQRHGCHSSCSRAGPQAFSQPCLHACTLMSGTRLVQPCRMTKCSYCLC